VAFPTLPLLPLVPARVDADRWLHAYDGQSFARRVQRSGRVMVADVPYHVPVALVGQQVAVRVDAQAGQFVVEANGRAVHHLAIHGIGVGWLPFATFVEQLCAATRTQKRAAFAAGTVQRRWRSHLLQRNE
jgi:hypothetical protein